MIDLRQTSQYSRYIRSIGWQVDNLDETNCFTKRIIYPSIIKIQRPTKIVAIDKIRKLSKEKRAIYVLIEPTSIDQYEYYKRQGFKDVRTPSLPSATIHIDLTKSEDDLLSSMHHKTRYNIGLAKRKDVKVSFSQDIKYFVQSWNKAARKRSMFIPMTREIMAIWNAFDRSAKILIAQVKDELAGGVLLISTSDVGYYMYAFTTPIGKKFFAPTLLAWKAIIEAKLGGARLFDFEGIYDERLPLKDWQGFTQFKKSFGGDVVVYPMPVAKYFPVSLFG